MNHGRAILTALDFLMRAQRTTGCSDRERGGFGASLASREQRIDVTVWPAGSSRASRMGSTGLRRERRSKEDIELMAGGMRCCP
jgi:hypothetical protein